MGFDRVCLALLAQHELEERAAGLIRSYPTRVFISYRRTGEEVTQLTQRLAIFLKARGYEVWLDTLSVQPGDALEQVPHFVSGLLGAQVFVPILDEAYTASISRPWIEAELDLAYLLALEGSLDIIGLFEPGLLSPWFTAFPLVPIAAADAFEQLAARIQPPRPRLDEQSRRQLRELCAVSYKLFDKGKPRTALKNIDRHVDLSDLEDVRELRHVAYTLMEDHTAAEEAYPYAKRPIAIGAVRRLEVAKHLRVSGRPHEALRVLHESLRGSGGLPQRLEAALLCSDILEDLGSCAAATNWFQYLSLKTRTREAAYGLVAMHLKQGHGALAAMLLESMQRTEDVTHSAVVRSALSCCASGDLRAALDVVNTRGRGRFGKNHEPLVQHPSFDKVEHSCSTCGARYYVNPAYERICASCGSVYWWSHGPGTGNCAFCAYTGILYVSPPGDESRVTSRCPICLDGEVEVSPIQSPQVRTFVVPKWDGDLA